MGGGAKADYVIWGENRTLQGPMELPALVAEVVQQRVRAETWVFVNAQGTWKRAADVPQLRRFFIPATKRNAERLGPSPSSQGVDIRSLRRLKVLADLSDHDLERFARFVEVQRVPQWSTVIKQGDRGKAMYLVLEGELSVRLKAGGTDTMLARLSMGDFFGDLALFDYGPRSADVIADSTAVLLRITAAAFAELVEQQPDIATPFLLAMGRTLSVRIRAANKRQAESAKYVRATG